MWVATSSKVNKSWSDTQHSLAGNDPCENRSKPCSFPHHRSKAVRLRGVNLKKPRVSFLIQYSATKFCDPKNSSFTLSKPRTLLSFTPHDGGRTVKKVWLSTGYPTPGSLCKGPVHSSLCAHPESALLTVILCRAP